MALAKRATLLDSGTTDAFRLLHDAADDTPGVVVEQFGPALVLQTHEGRCTYSETELRAACEWLAAERGARAIYRKVFARDRSAAREQLDTLHNDAQPWLGDPVEPEFAVRENGGRFLVHLYDGYSTGLFLDQRGNRARVRQWAAEKRVLNLFAYTCSFSVAAALGGAAETVNVDVSKKYLDWGRRNFAANDLPAEAHRFYPDDALDYLARAARRGEQYDLVIVDPPTFGRAKRPRRVFSLAEQLNALVAAAARVVAAGGQMLVSVNHRATTQNELENALLRATDAAQIDVVERPRPEPDFRGDVDYMKAVFARIG